MGLITELFQQSPFEPLLHHLKIVRQCVTLVRPMLEAVKDEEYDQLDELVKRVFKTEHEADMIKDEIRQVIPRSFFLPVYRGDLLGYLKLQDDMADAVEDLAILLTIKKLSMPQKLVTQLFAYVETVLTACDKNHEMNERLPDIIARGFMADQVPGLLELVRSVEMAEWEADKSQYALSKALFAMEDELKASDLMIWWRVFLELGQLANHAEKMAERLRRMLSQ